MPSKSKIERQTRADEKKRLKAQGGDPPVSRYAAKGAPPPREEPRKLTGVQFNDRGRR